MKRLFTLEDIALTNTSAIDLQDIPLSDNPKEIIRRKVESKKNSFIRPYVYLLPNQIINNKKDEKNKLIIKNFKMYLDQLEAINNERSKEHARWLHYLRSDETSEDGSP